MKQVRVILLVLAVVGLAFLVGSYKVTINRQLQERTALEEEKSELETELIIQKYYDDEENNLDTCLSKADRDANSYWMANCKNFGSNFEKDDDGEITSCSLPGYLSERVKEKKQTDKDNCFRRYSK